MRLVFVDNGQPLPSEVRIVDIAAADREYARNDKGEFASSGSPADKAHAAARGLLGKVDSGQSLTPEEHGKLQSNLAKMKKGDLVALSAERGSATTPGVAGKKADLAGHIGRIATSDSKYNADKAAAEAQSRVSQNAANPQKQADAVKGAVGLSTPTKTADSAAPAIAAAAAKAKFDDAPGFAKGVAAASGIIGGGTQSLVDRYGPVAGRAIAGVGLLGGIAGGALGSLAAAGVFAGLGPVFVTLASAGVSDDLGIGKAAGGLVSGGASIGAAIAAAPVVAMAHVYENLRGRRLNSEAAELDIRAADGSSLSPDDVVRLGVQFWNDMESQYVAKATADGLYQESDESVSERADLGAGIAAGAMAGSRMSAVAFLGLEASAGKPKRFSMVAYSGGPLKLKDFPHPVYADMRGMKIVSQNNPALREHDRERAVGHTDKVEAGADYKLRIEGEISCTGPHVDELLDRARANYPWQASIGTSIDKLDVVAAGESATVNGRQITGPAYIARKTTFREISFVVLGGDAETTVHLAASLGDGSMNPTFEKWAADRGSDLSKLTAPQRTMLQATFDAEVAKLGGVGHGNSVAELAAAIMPQLQAAFALQTKIGQLPTELQATALAEKWDAGRIQAELDLDRLRKGRVAGPFISASGPAEQHPTTIEAALCISAKMPDNRLAQHFQPQTLEMAEKHFRRLGLQGLLLQAAAGNGYAVRIGNDQIRSDTKGVLQAAFSTNAITNILSNVANKFLLTGYQNTDQAWRKIARVRSVKDFKQTSSYRLTSPDVWEEIGPGGKIKFGSLADQTFTNQAKTYAKMVSITRNDIINDDLGALSEAPMQLGQGAGDKLNLVFWTAWLNDSAFFKTGNANYFAGGTTNLQSSSLVTAEQKFAAQVKPNGHPLGVMAKILLIPSTLKRTAWELMQSGMYVAGGDTTVGKVPATNTWQGTYDVVSTQYLESATLAIPGYSPTGWYLLADPNTIPSIEACFLDGNEIPTIEQADADFSTLGIEMRGYHDFGVNLQDYRGAVKSKGAA